VVERLSGRGGSTLAVIRVLSSLALLALALVDTHKWA
jgi:hypothetical protein